jgi:DNA-nicking Smr family endonuclease
MSRRRQLSEEEEALWAAFVRSIKPLRGSAKTKKSATPAATPRAEAPTVAKVHEPAPRPKPASSAPPLAPLGRRLKQRVARGREPIEARIDLHGMTQREAHARLLRFLERAQADGARIALVVTGKGKGRSENDSEREPGVLKRQVPLWLSLPEFRAFVVGFEDAHIGHGGEGALYVRLRRSR